MRLSFAGSSPLCDNAARLSSGRRHFDERGPRRVPRDSHYNRVTP
jgi:hypothetical protein